MPQPFRYQDINSNRWTRVRGCYCSPKDRGWRCLFYIAFGTLLLVNAACNGPRASSPAQQQVIGIRDYTDSIKQLVGKLQTGDIALRRGRGPDSYMLAHLNLHDQSYSHCGIVVVENGYPFVYHSIGGEDNPDERLRRDSAIYFFRQLHNYGIAAVRYTVADTVCEKLVGVIHHYYQQRPLFDMSFDLNTDDRLYCSEFVFKAFIASTGDTGFIKTSFGHGRRFVGIDDIYSNGRAHFISKVNFK